MKDLGRRLPTTIALIIFAYAAIRYLPVPYFSALLYLLASLAAWELMRLVKPSRHAWPLVFSNGLLVALAFTVDWFDLSHALAACLLADGLFFLFTVNSRERLAQFSRDWGALALAVLYVYFPLFYMLELKKLGAEGNYLFFLILVIAIGDSGAYFVGSALGRHKIYPVASPKKSLEGLIAAVLTAGLSGWLSLLLFPVPVAVPAAVATAAVIGLFSQLSDPVESLFKRAAGQKDSGALLPGHGGVLDRVDSYIFCAPLLYYVVRYFWN